MASVTVHNQTSAPLTMSDGRTVAAFSDLSGVDDEKQPQASYLLSGKLVVVAGGPDPDPDEDFIYSGVLKGDLQGDHGTFGQGTNNSGRVVFDARDADTDDPLLWNGANGFQAKKLPLSALEDPVVSTAELAGGTTDQVLTKASNADGDYEWADGGSGLGLPSNIVNRTTGYTAAAGDFVLANAASGGFAITLPVAPATGALVTAKKVDGTGNIVTIVPAGGGTIDGDADATITSPQFGAVLEHVGSNAWKIVAPTSTGGSNGINGTNGNTVLNGSGAPNVSAGVNGDFYIDTTNSRLYGPKASGAWPGGYTSLVGPAGSLNKVQDEGVVLTLRDTVNFTGGGVTATDDAGNLRTNVTIPGGGISVGFASGSYYATGNQSGNTSPAAGTMSTTPFLVTKSQAFSSIAITVQGTAVGSAVRLGIYADDGNGRPGALVIDAGTIDSAGSTGRKDIAISQTLQAGVYWLAAASQGGAPSLYATRSDTFPAAPLLPSDSGGFNAISGWQQTGVTGALPANATPVSGGAFPRVLLKAA